MENHEEQVMGEETTGAGQGANTEGFKAKGSCKGTRLDLNNT